MKAPHFNTARAVALGALIIAGLAPIASVRADERRSTLSIIFENDLFYHTDRDYTNGVEVSWSPPQAASEMLPAAFDVTLSNFIDLERSRAAYSFGQMMFTPEHTDLATPIAGERPYAGFLYGALSLAGTEDTQESLVRVQLGMIGPASLAADSQKFIHSLRGFTFPKGWSTQLRDEPGLVLTYQKSQAIGSFTAQNGAGMDFKTHIGGTVGNVFDYLNAGAVGRVGFHIPADDGPPRMAPAAPGSYFYEPDGGFGVYVFAGAEARLMGRNIFLDGNTFQSSQRVGKNLIVGDLMVGGAIAFENFRLSFVHMFRSREYARQNEFEQFGTLNLSVNM